uniref:hypothetical protein n=1 Tax=Arthrobacter sp. H41 TaxID=1312978 RepID=UPI00047E5FF7
MDTGVAMLVVPRWVELPVGPPTSGVAFDGEAVAFADLLTDTVDTIRAGTGIRKAAGLHPVEIH